MAEPRDPSVADPATPPSDDASPPAPSQTELRTFLIADIRGYTTYTREHGDEAAAALAARFAELVAEVVKTHDGFLLELRGDEALVVFVSARKALRAAVDLHARFAEDKLPRGVGIGLDAGEAIAVGNGYRGTALNLAARLCAKAGPGETLASEAVIHLAAKVDGIAYVDARDLRLKGYTDAVRVLGVVAADQTKGHRLATGRHSGGLGRNRLAAIAGASVVLIAVVAALISGGWLTARGDDPSGTPTAQPDPLAGLELPVLAFYDANTGALKTTMPFAAPRNLAFFTGGSFWMLAENPMALHRIDPSTHRIQQTHAIPVDSPSGFNFDDQFFWVTDLSAPELTRIDQRTGVDTTFSFARGADDTAPAHDVAVGAGSVWLSRPDAEEIVRLNRDTGKVQARIKVAPFGLSFGAGGLWWWREGQIGRIDPATNEATFDPIELSTDSWLGNIYFAGGDAWTASANVGRLWRVDREGHQTTYTLEPGASEMAPTDETMWVTNAETGKLTGIDLVTGLQTREIHPGHAILAAAAGNGELMIAIGPTFEDAVAGLDGSVLTVSTNGIPWWDPAPDPPLNGTWQVRQTLYLTCAGLLSYPDKPGAEGLTLQPEAATAMPTVSADGRTYTFTIKAGLQFSPPSNEAVTAETFRYSIERALSPEFEEWQPGPAIFADIVGAQDFRAGDSAHVAGLAVAGDELSITLQEPAPDILDRLASSYACPVPVNTPAIQGGLNPIPPIAGAGPYYLAEVFQRRFIVLGKNPNYHGDRPQPFDTIAIRMQTAPSTAIAMVEDGKVDAAMFDGFDPLTSPTSGLAVRWGPGRAQAADDQRWFGASRPEVSYLAMNPSGPAFRDRDVRRAVALGLDRAALSRVFVLGPTADLLVPAVRGSADPDASVEPPDPGAARRLLNGRDLTITMQGFPDEWGCQPCRNFELEVKRQLKRIGITVAIRHPDGDEYPGDALDPGSDIDLLEFGTGSEFPDPAAFLHGLQENGWLGEANLRELARLNDLAGEARVRGAAALARRIVDEQFLVVPYGHPVYPFFIGDRIGCGFVQPAIGAFDLLSLCVK